MPTCLEGYVSKKVAALMDGYFHHCSILTIAQSLKEQICGSADGMTDEYRNAAAEIIEFYINHWVSSDSEYDACVLSLLKATKRMWDKHRLMLRKLKPKEERK